MESTIQYTVDTHVMFTYCLAKFNGQFLNSNVFLEVWVWSSAPIVLFSEWNIRFFLYYTKKQKCVKCVVCEVCVECVVCVECARCM